MSILVNKNTRVLTQGITGATGQFHTKACKEYGTADGRRRDARAKAARLRGDSDLRHRCAKRSRETGANATVIYVPPPFAADAILEAADADIPLIICITEGVPVRDMMR